MATTPAEQTSTEDGTNQTTSSNVQPAETMLENDDLVADNDADSAYAGSDGSQFETQSMASMYKGYFKFGRRFENFSDHEYYQPSDDKQWDSMNAGHMLFLILDSQRKNPLFQSPISPNAHNVIDLGTGSGEWALDVADKYPNLNVRAVDLSPPPEWTAPNCTFEVEDVTRDWSYNIKWDLVHMRHLLGAMSERDWTKLYKQAYDNMAPGGWIEQVEQDVGMYCDDDTLPSDSILVPLREMFIRAAARSGRPLDTMLQMSSRIEAAGFVNVQQQDYKMPIGPWPKLQVYKDAGNINRLQIRAGMEGWIIWLLTNYGEPEPWTQQQVSDYLAELGQDLDAGYHVYYKARRVWAQKPYDEEEPKTVQEPAMENVGSPSPTQPSKEKQKTEESGVVGGS